MTGTAWVRESGLVEGPVVLTNTNSVGVVRDAVIQYAARRWPPKPDGAWTFWSLPIVAETWDGTLNDIYDPHVRPEHLFAALDTAAAGPVAEGNVGGGTGMTCYGFKGGIGTASRVLARRAATRWARSCRRTTAAAISSWWRASRSERRSAKAPLPGTRWAPSSSWWPRTRRSCRISSSASPAGPRSASRARARSPATDRATSSSPSRPPTRTPVTAKACPR